MQPNLISKWCNLIENWDTEEVLWKATEEDTCSGRGRGWWGSEDKLIEKANIWLGPFICSTITVKCCYQVLVPEGQPLWNGVQTHEEMVKYRVIHMGQPSTAMRDCVYKDWHLFLIPTKVLSGHQSLYSRCLKDWPQPLSYKNSNKHKALWVSFASTDKANSQKHSHILPVGSCCSSQPHHPIFHGHRQPCLNVV